MTDLREINVKDLLENEPITFEVRFKSPPLKFKNGDLMITSSMTSETASIKCRTPLNNVLGFQLVEVDTVHAVFTWTNEAECTYQLKITKGFDDTDIEPVIKDVPQGTNKFTINELEVATVYGVSIKKTCGEYESLYSSPRKIETTNINNNEQKIIKALFDRTVRLNITYFLVYKTLID